MENAKVMAKLVQIQAELKAPKSQYNSFAKYNYRSCEDITEAAKPICAKYGCALTLNDTVLFIGARYYIQAEARLTDGETGEFVSVTANAREEDSKKGYDASQLTGATSSYARKYALSGLFALDDTKDSDFTNTGDKGKKSDTPTYEAPPKPAAPPKTDGPMIGSGQTPTAAPVEYKCAMCGKPITAVTLKSGQVLSAAEVYEQLKGLNTDGVCRCRECRAKAGTDIPKG